ncbi:MAG: sporulation transcription factor Spo0A [Bacilli bacterium]|nr:sporulation transcription factor Spo0A [Bacilli bacterium]
MKIKVLVVDDNEVSVSLMKNYFNNSEVTIMDVALNGLEAVNLLSDNNYDVILLDLIMPVRDGFYVLDYLKDNKINIPVIVVSSYNESDTIRKVSEYGVKYYALKPFNLDDIKARIIDLYNNKVNNDSIIELSNKSLQIEVTNILHSLGIPSHIKGYQYIRSGILMVYENPSFIGSITKELYPGISNKFNTSIQRVERAIRHAIEIAWLRGDIDLMEEIFGHSVDIDRAKPTNSEFIVTIADKLRLDMIGV